MSRDHPVILALRETTRIRPADLDYLIDHGQNYRGAALPRGVKRQPLGECLPGAMELEDRGHGKLVTGFVLQPGDTRPMQHYWATPGDNMALDPTLRDPRANFYWGLGERHRDHVSRITASAFRSATSAGVPLDLARGGLFSHMLKPMKIRLL